MNGGEMGGCDLLRANGVSYGENARMHVALFNADMMGVSSGIHGKLRIHHGVFHRMVRVYDYVRYRRCVFLRQKPCP